MLLQAAVKAASFRPLQWQGQPYAEALYITFYQRSPGNSPMLSPAIILCLAADYFYSRGAV
jgi:hypothetical protein